MDLQNIQEQLNAEFSKQGIRLIFWFDDKGDYADEVSEKIICKRFHTKLSAKTK